MKRHTIQRAPVLAAVNKPRCHATADEVYQTVAEEYPNIGRATVHRNLNALAKEGVVRKPEIPGGADCFDHICTNHCHVRCEKCGRIFDVDMDFVSDLEKNIRDAHGFAMNGYDILFRGICPACQNASDCKKD